MKKKSGIAVVITLLIMVLIGMSSAIAQKRPIEKASYADAHQILGNDFITPEEVSTTLGFNYTEEQLSYFKETLPSEEKLRWVKTNGYALIPGPSTSLNILNMHVFKPQFFHGALFPEKAWYINHNFAKNDFVTTKWLVIKKKPLLDSVDKFWPDQISLLRANEYVPNIAEISWSMIVFYEIRKERFFERVYVRTASLVSDGNHVIVGYFGPHGMVIHSYWDRYRTYTIGITTLKHY